MNNLRIYIYIYIYLLYILYKYYSTYYICIYIYSSAVKFKILVFLENLKKNSKKNIKF